MAEGSRLQDGRRRGMILAGSAILAPAFLAATVPTAVATHDYDTVYPTFAQRGGNGIAFNHLCYNGTITNRDLFCQQDNVDPVTVFREASINALGKQRIYEVIESEYDVGLPLNVTWPANPKYTDDKETDLIAQQGTQMPPEDNGWTWCNDAVDNRLYRCDQHYAQFRYTEVSRRLACHEAGHAMGLVHGKYSDPPLSGGSGDNRLGCMQDPIPTVNDGELGTLERHNLNYEYGPTSATASSDPYKE